MNDDRPTMLVADTPDGIATLRFIFSDVTSRWLSASTIEGARACVRQQPDVILCGIHFDNSLMFDLLREVKQDAATAHIPFVGYRDLDSDIGPAVLEGLDIACRALSGQAFIDLYSLRNRKGVLRADAELRAVVLDLGRTG
jgi:CheY-like chemotaxis protein